MKKIHDKTFKPFIKQEEISEKIKELAEDLDRQFATEKPVLIAVLNGAFVFASDLVRALESNVEIYFTKLSSYEGTKSTGNVRLDYFPEMDLKGKDVYIVEDIVETGKSISFLRQHLKQFQLRNIKVISLLYKPNAVQEKLDVDYHCFEIGNRFVVGYGLDYNQLGRDLPEIYVIDD